MEPTCLLRARARVSPQLVCLDFLELLDFLGVRDAVGCGGHSVPSRFLFSESMPAAVVLPLRLLQDLICSCFLNRGLVM